MGIPQCKKKLSNHVWCSILQNKIPFYWSKSNLRIEGSNLKPKTILETEKDGQANLADVCGKRLSLFSGMCSLFECLIPLFVVMLEPSQWDLSRGKMCVHNGVMWDSYYYPIFDPCFDNFFKKSERERTYNDNIEHQG
jgi:hypothetical protein